MIKIRYHIYILFLCCNFNFTVLASNFAEEENFVNSFADSAISILSSDSLSDAERTSSFTELVMSSIDLNLISKFVLSKAWKNASDEQKEEYLIAFKDYFINSYANKLDQYTGEKVDVIGSQEAGKYVIVESNIIREGTDTLKINLKWRLLNKNNQIKIIDLNIEGISLVIAQREEFQSFLANNDYDLDKLIEKIVSVSD
jgi:phospholipid transport system substrate-binding protein